MNRLTDCTFQFAFCFGFVPGVREISCARTCILTHCIVTLADSCSIIVKLQMENVFGSFNPPASASPKRRPEVHHRKATSTGSALEVNELVNRINALREEAKKRHAAEGGGRAKSPSKVERKSVSDDAFKKADPVTVRLAIRREHSTRHSLPNCSLNTHFAGRLETVRAELAAWDEKDKEDLRSPQKGQHRPNTGSLSYFGMHFPPPATAAGRRPDTSDGGRPAHSPAASPTANANASAASQDHAIVLADHHRTHSGSRLTPRSSYSLKSEEKLRVRVNCCSVAC